MAQSGGEVLAQCLAQEGVRFVFGLMSPEVDPFLAALEANGMRFIPVRHEAAAAYMAEGVYKTTGQVAATVTNPGPGTANLIPGIVTARHEGVPFIAITSQHRPDLIYPASPTTFQGQDQLALLRPAVKWGAPIFSRDQIADVTRMAFREMWLGRPGPVQLDISAPVMYAEGDAVSLLEPTAYRAAAPSAGVAQLAAATALLSQARRPLIIAGSGVDRGRAAGGVLALAQRLDCAVITTLAGRSAIPQDHERHLYGYGAGADEARREADVLLALGTRLGNIDTPYARYWGDGSGQKLVHIDIDPRNIGVSRPVSLGIVSDLNAAIDGLLTGLEPAPDRPGAAHDLARYRAAESAWREAQFGSIEAYEGAAPHPAAVMKAVGRLFGPSAIYAADGGFTSLWAHFMLPATRARSYLNILEMGMLGTGIPSAIGAKLANPDREVVCVTGDGAAGFHGLELQSAVREGLKITVVVFAEGSWSMEVPNEEARYGRTFGTEMGPIRWDRIAEGLGCQGFYVESMHELDAALASARTSPGAALVCVRTDRNANLSVPPATALRFHEGYQGLRA